MIVDTREIPSSQPPKVFIIAVLSSHRVYVIGKTTGGLIARIDAARHEGDVDVEMRVGEMSLQILNRSVDVEGASCETFVEGV